MRMTPNDVGRSIEGRVLRSSARQNVLLELGMLFMELGRRRVAIVSKQCVNGIEFSSDIGGVLRIPYVSGVAEVVERFAKEHNARGYSIG